MTGSVLDRSLVRFRATYMINAYSVRDLAMITKEGLIFRRKFAA